ncbi:uncharacterized protein I206_105193 [Kwoniella pini CBS 10737]|uniref:Alpha/beta hydrolase fold-3 domain-containing protein n=1 Tax=Kwoniella pini CBS 10737 TaxID=1296096 RepID=A0A1B9I4X4_9TREE|nr:uncharacterized protein I206_03898 [Kwoniella pini CBS 10737]OCF50573.1 hypothetical protein I206_03898 [Kwoniella pini CBS 10737]
MTSLTHSDQDPQKSNSIPSKWSLLLQAKLLRQAGSLGLSLLQMYYAPPIVPSPNKTIYIDSIFGDIENQSKKSIRLDIYFPKEEEEDKEENYKLKSKPCLINFHGGGFVIGQGTDDSLFAKMSIEKSKFIFITVSYRLSPEFPFPIPIEDCLSSIIYIGNNLKDLNINEDKILLSGFSAGGNLALSCLNILNSLKTNSNEWGYKNSLKNQIIPKIKGIILFYPSLNYNISREEKIKNMIKPENALPTNLTRLFDFSYLPGNYKNGNTLIEIDRKDIRISPVLASDDLLNSLPPVWITICEYDMLRQEGLDFVNKLKSLNKEVEFSEVKGEKHGWDKPLPITPKPSVIEEYDKALEAAERWLS